MCRSTLLQREVKWTLCQHDALLRDFWGWRVSVKEAHTSCGDTLPPHFPSPETFDGALTFLKRDRGSKRQTTQLGNPPDISTFQRSGPRYVTIALHTWQQRLVLYCIWEHMALLTAFVKNSWLKEADQLWSSEWSGSEQHLLRHTQY